MPALSSLESDNQLGCGCQIPTTDRQWVKERLVTYIGVITARLSRHGDARADDDQETDGVDLWSGLKVCRLASLFVSHNRGVY